MYALKHLPVSTVSLYAYVNPVIAVALGALLLGEPFGPRVVIASAMVLVGIAVVRGLAGPKGPAIRVPTESHGSGLYRPGVRRLSDR